MPIAEVRIANGEHDLDVLPQSRAGRLDVFVRDADGNQYDVEVQASSGTNEVLRARYYQALMDVTYLRKGHKVDELRRSAVIFICDFDPLGKGLRRYDCTARCKQTGEEIGDGRRLVMLSTAEGEGDLAPELDAFLRFVAGRRVDGDGFIDDIRRKIRDLVLSPKWMEAYMTFEEELKAAARQAAREAAREAAIEAERRGEASMLARMLDAGVLDEARACELLGMGASVMGCRALRWRIRPLASCMPSRWSVGRG